MEPLPLITRAILPGNKPPPPAPMPIPALPKKQTYYILGARIQVLTLWENGTLIPEVITKTRVSRTVLYNIRTKTYSCSWVLHKVLETWYIDDAPHKDRPPLSTALVKFVMETMTKNSITRV
jgi:hypothetical protein